MGLAHQLPIRPVSNKKFIQQEALPKGGLFFVKVMLSGTAFPYALKNLLKQISKGKPPQWCASMALFAMRILCPLVFDCFMWEGIFS
jgi:hypothetical protein